jgi:hypothetical protein
MLLTHMRNEASDHQTQPTGGRTGGPADPGHWGRGVLKGGVLEGGVLEGGGAGHR